MNPFEYLSFWLNLLFFFSTARESNLNSLIQTHPLAKFKYNEQKKMCLDAKEYVSRRGIPVKFFHTEMGVQILRIDHNLGKYTIQTGESCGYYVCLKCPIVPATVLFIAAEDCDTIRIVVERNPFLEEHYVFLEEVVETVQYLAGEFLVKF